MARARHSAVIERGRIDCEQHQGPFQTKSSPVYATRGWGEMSSLMKFFKGHARRIQVQREKSSHLAMFEISLPSVCIVVPCKCAINVLITLFVNGLFRWELWSSVFNWVDDAQQLVITIIEFEENRTWLINYRRNLFDDSCRWGLNFLFFGW